VDTPGESLEIVIVTRLPFKVPTEPVLKARMEKLKMDGRDPFRELSLPDAVIRLKQGFGRLMRRKTDCGIVLILDSRVITRYYGKYFIESLPKTARAEGSTLNVIRVLEEFVVKMRTGKIGR